jgi:valyl-tRNA synthetase
MEISTKYNPKEIEGQWYETWMKNGLFHSEPDERTPYTIVIPPPNVTGMLHMGHMLNNTLQDVLIRRARMQGFNACWVPGTDHASIATEAKVVDMLSKQGIKKSDLSREQFLAHAFEWKEKYGGIILEQLQKLGCSCDWERTRFTMEEDLYKSVIKVFVDLHQKGLIYRGTRMVNWDPVGKTALSDEEVIHSEENSQLYYLSYALSDGSGSVQIATTRPETILGDTAICVHPDDPRYAHLKGKQALVPIVNRPIPIIFDEYVEREFGTGALKVTPAHDLNDYELGKKHGLETINIFNDDASIADHIGIYQGMDRFKLRKQIATDLEACGALVKTESLKNKVGRSERTRAVIEPRLSEQWFVDMQQFMDLHPEVLDNVLNDEISFYPKNLKNTYRHWLEGIKDWCISRQLWWGQQIPAYYLPNGEIVVAESIEEALLKAKELDSSLQLSDLRQDPDVLDTWFSSWLWPISVFNGIMEPKNSDIRYYYPTQTLVTGPDIIFFWVARMIMSGYAYEGEKPFQNVYFTGIVRDKQRRKMSKQLGNSPDPIELMEQFGTDGVRMGLMLSAPAGNDLLFDEALCEQGRNFSNKIWNAFRLISGWEAGNESDEFYANNATFINGWMRERIDASIVEIDAAFSQFRVSEAMMTIYRLVWGDFCSWYLEMMKPGMDKLLPAAQLEQVKLFFDELLRMLHPFMPFITEDLWQQLFDRNGVFINQQDYPTSTNCKGYTEEMDFAMELIATVRALRNENGISPRVSCRIYQVQNAEIGIDNTKNIISKLANIEAFSSDKSAEDNLVKLVRASELSFAFEGFEPNAIDLDKLENELSRLKSFLLGIEKKLSNEKFMANANEEVIEREKMKQKDALSKMEAIQRELSQNAK